MHWGFGCQKTDVADVEENIKPVYYTKIIRRYKIAFCLKVQFQVSAEQKQECARKHKRHKEQVQKRYTQEYLLF